MNIREANRADTAAWSDMRTDLWPDSDDHHVSEIEQYFSGVSIDIAQAYVGEIESVVMAFLELSVRHYAEGSRSPKVPYVEAWYIKSGYRGRGYGTQLMQHAETWAVRQGFSELASDTEIDNTRSIAIHKRLGFSETERIVCFLKRLD